ncbi:MAG: hypothetical protein Q9159_006969 [Coniocarpon cinnabarinum]
MASAPSPGLESPDRGTGIHSGLERYWWDDWLCLCSLPFFFAIAGPSFAWDTNGLGKHVWAVPPEQVRYGLKLFYYGFIPYQIGITLPKLSCVMFYARVFGQRSSTGLRLNLWILGILIVINSIVCIIANILQCQPVDQYWKQTKPNSCFNIVLWQILHAVTNLIFDLYILVLPMPILAKLQTSKRKRVLVITIFALGYGVALISIGALIAIALPGEAFLTDVTWQSVPPLYFELLEPSTAIICICLPSISNLVRRGQKQGIRSIFMHNPPMTSGTVKRPTYPATTFTKGFMRLGGRGESGENIMLAETANPDKGKIAVAASGRSAIDPCGDLIDRDNIHEIHVRRDFEVTIERLLEDM